MKRKKAKRIIDTSGIPLLPEIELNGENFNIIDEGVRKLVETLYKKGYKTVCSCGGHLHALEPYPWVVIIPDYSNGKIPELLRAIGKFNRSCGKDGKMPKAMDTWALNPMQTDVGNALYLQPADINISLSFNRLDALRKSSEKLSEYISALNC